MTSLQHRGRLVVLYVAAICIGATLAAASTSTQTVPAVYAAPHCTKYGPNLLDPDTNCYINSSAAGNGHWQTSSVAWRDFNKFTVTSNRTLCVGYINSFSGCSGDSLFSQIGQDTSAQRKAECDLIGSGVFGNCTTEWHD